MKICERRFTGKDLSVDADPGPNQGRSGAAFPESPQRVWGVIPSRPQLRPEKRPGSHVARV